MMADLWLKGSLLTYRSAQGEPRNAQREPKGGQARPGQGMAMEAPWRSRKRETVGGSLKQSFGSIQEGQKLAVVPFPGKGLKMWEGCSKSSSLEFEDFP